MLILYFELITVCRTRYFLWHSLKCVQVQQCCVNPKAFDLRLDLAVLCELVGTESVNMAESMRSRGVSKLELELELAMAMAMDMETMHRFTGYTLTTTQMTMRHRQSHPCPNPMHRMPHNHIL
mmetsp:Transcript_15641/g.23318  ORF Transcript_15641/g.23318 Transcript_15641/m.23318 type:complete len:123 (+) Transcript_15641:149-517(+)